MAVRVESNAEPIPGYRLIERIGGGGFGEVWKVEAPGGLMKAQKFVYGDLQTVDEEEGVRAEQELKAMKRVLTIRHPYILSLERFDIIDGQLIITMELADRNLWDRFRECRSEGLPGIPRVELLSFMAEIAEALDLMNKDHQLQHLDIKPQNLFVVHNHIKVADFGLVKDLEGMVASVTGGVTPVYAAPETFDGWVSRYCDQYSLAIVYQELLTGQRPFSSTNVRQLVLAHMQGVPDLSSLPPCDRDAIARALAKNPENRHPSCHVLVKALQEAEGRDKKIENGKLGAAVDTPSGRSSSADLRPSDATPADGEPEAGPVTSFIRAHEDSAKQTPVQRLALPPQDTPGRLATPEVVGDGQLFPALIIGLGSVGLGVLKRLSASLSERFGRMEMLPNVRLLHIDTDPDAIRAAGSDDDGGQLSRQNVLLAPLHRASYYLKPREGRVRIDTWLDPKMLYRIPRQAFSAGMRALGRLAFVDNYRAITLRLQSDLEACTDPEALTEASRQTGLGIRASKPRVYVISSLGGGTGSGMFLDLAYVVRTLLKQQGYDQSEVVGLFTLPAAQRGVSHATELGNAYAALTELNHFSRQGTTFSANYDTHESRVTGPIVDAGAPFTRCFLLPSHRAGAAGGANGDSSGTYAASASESLALASHFLVCDLTTSVGRSADITRRERLMQVAESSAASAPSAKGVELYCQTFGMHRLVWPRRALLQKSARHICKRLVERWMTKDSKPIREKVKQWVEERWTRHELGADVLIGNLQQACVREMKMAPELVFSQICERVGRLATPEGEAELSAELVSEVLGQLEQLLGRPNDNASVMRQDKSGPPTEVESHLREAGEGLLAQLSEKMAEIVAELIEQPAFRLAGAEEAIRQITGTIEQTLQAQEQIAKELGERAANAFASVVAVYKAIKAGKVVKSAGKRLGKAAWWGAGGGNNEGAESLPGQLHDLLKLYCKSRYQSLVLQRVIAIFVSLRGQLSDQMREVGFCRNRLTELGKLFGTRGLARKGSVAVPADPAERSRVRYLYPPGCHSLEDGITRLVGAFAEEHLNDLDQRMETLIRRDFTALVHVCLSAANMLSNLEMAMQKETETVLEGRLVGTKVAEMYLAEETVEGDPEKTLKESIMAGFEDAAPDLSGLITGARPACSTEICILAAPSDSTDEKASPGLREAALGALDGQQVLVVDPGTGTASHEILYYREEACLALSDLKLLGPMGRDAYRQMTSVDHFTPHTRIDITDWQLAGKS